MVIFREFSFSNQTIEPELLNLLATILVLALPCTKKHNIWSKFHHHVCHGVFFNVKMNRNL